MRVEKQVLTNVIGIRVLFSAGSYCRSWLPPTWILQQLDLLDHESNTLVLQTS